MNQQKSILIPNATGASNIGDAAMLEVLLKILQEGGGASIIVHSSEPGTYNNTSHVTFKETLYHWIAFENRSFPVRSWRLIQFVFIYLLNRLNLPISKNNKIQKLINEYKAAKLLVFAPGGYLRSRPGLTQSLNLLMQIAPFIVARLSKAKKIVAPISFGPFAYKWQEYLSAKALNNIDMVTVREKYSYDVLIKRRVSNVTLLSDIALLTPKKSSNWQTKNFIVGFTIRNWLSRKKQNSFENFMVEALVNFSKNTGSIIQPIVQVDSPKYGDHDLLITKKVANALKQAGTKVLDIITIKSVEQASGVYSQINLLLGMRMHSNILAATQGIPFLGISYEYKTEGIAKDLGVERFCIKVENATADKILSLLFQLYEQYEEIQNILGQALVNINQKNSNYWKGVLKNYAH